MVRKTTLKHMLLFRSLRLHKNFFRGYHTEKNEGTYNLNSYYVPRRRRTQLYMFSSKHPEVFYVIPVTPTKIYLTPFLQAVFCFYVNTIKKLLNLSQQLICRC